MCQNDAMCISRAFGMSSRGAGYMSQNRTSAVFFLRLSRGKKGELRSTSVRPPRSTLPSLPASVAGEGGFGFGPELRATAPLADDLAGAPDGFKVDDHPLRVLLAYPYPRLVQFNGGELPRLVNQRTFDRGKLRHPRSNEIAPRIVVVPLFDRIVHTSIARIRKLSHPVARSERMQASTNG
jgi:hypothetical protein